jgi:lipopolysaccharide transport system ATP-binding protein
MSEPIIRVENLSKSYIIGHQGPRERYQSLRDTLSHHARNFTRRTLETLRGRQVPQGDSTEEFWALKDVSFEVKEGEVLGIIGRNGAGKSTLLKILSRITEPTSGRVTIDGRVASLLEVGTGFHPELTGRENLYLNGAILGMTRKEIKMKFDEIVDFAGVEKFLDTPVKRYSSGMYVRLAFAVAAHLEPEILIVDEVLAVGDAEFQKKCLGKMQDVASVGRTVLFVSHNMAAVSSFCTRAILMEKGKIIENSNVIEVINIYNSNSIYASSWEGDAGDESIRLRKTWVRSLAENGDFNTTSRIEIGIEIEVVRPIRGLIFGFNLLSEQEQPLAFVLYDDNESGEAPLIQPSILSKKFTIPANTLTEGTYHVAFDCGIYMTKRIIRDEGRLSFRLENTSGLGTRFVVPHHPNYTSLFRPNWT